MSQSRPLQTVVLLGGETGERVVSIHSGLAVAGALARLGHQVRLLDPATGHLRPFGASDDPGAAGADFEARTPDPGCILPSLVALDPRETRMVANLLHGGVGENGQVASILELRGMAYFGCGPAGAAVAMDKVLAKRVFRAEGIPVAREFTWGGRQGSDGPPAEGQATPPVPNPDQLAAVGGYPLVVKPIDGGSTIGLTVVRGPDDWAAAWAAGGPLADPERGLLVEEFIPGRELTVGVLGDRALPLIEIRPKDGFYDYRNKYEKGRTEYDVPARLPEADRARLEDFGLRAFRALGCRDLGRTDFRLAPDGRCAVLEVNTVPGMTETSLIPKAAAAVGLSFDDLVADLCGRAEARARRRRGH
jgi:D-alanine-D-alanine ligase